jgi:hypothetical protein
MADVISKNYEVATSFGIYTFTVTSDENGFTSVGNIRRNGVVWTNDYPAEVHAAIQDAIIEIETLNGSNPQNFLVVDNLLSEIADLGVASQANARTNLGIVDTLSSIGDLQDVDLGDGIVNGKILQVVGGVFTQVDPANGGGGFTQEDIEDFVGGMFQDGGGVTWTYDDANSQISGVVTIDHLSISGLSDVLIAGAVDGHILRYNGVAFVNQVLSYNDLSDTPAFGTASTKDTGTNVGEVLEFAEQSTLPALDGANLTALPSINTLSDVDTQGIQNGDTIVYNNGSFSPGLVSSVSSANDLDDVTVANPVLNQVLVYDGANFTNRALSSADLQDGADLLTANSSIGDLNDVSLVGNLVNGKILQVVGGVLEQVNPPNTGFTQEEVEDLVGGQFTHLNHSTGMSFTYDDASSEIRGSLDQSLQDIANAGQALNNILISDGNNIVLKTPAQARVALDLEVGIDVQEQNDRLTEISDIAQPTADHFLAGDGADLVLKTPVEARLSLEIDPANARATLGFGTAVTNDTGDFLASGSGLDDLNDVAVVAPVNKHVIIHDGVNFENRTLATTDLADGASVPLLQGGNLTLNGSLSVGEITLTDNQAEALVISEGGNNYLTFVTTDAGERIVVGVEAELQSNLVVTGTGTITAPAAAANGNEIVTASWIRSLTLSDLTDTTEDVQDIAGVMFNHVNHSTGITFTYDDINNRVDASLASSLQDLSQLNRANGNFIVGDGNNFVVLANQNARDALGLGSASTSEVADFLASGSGLEDLADVSIAGVAPIQMLVSDAQGDFSNRTISTADLSNGSKVPLLDGSDELILANTFKPNGGINVNNLFLVEGLTGNTEISGSLSVDGLSSMEGGLNVVNPNTGANSLSITPNGNDATVNSAGGNISFNAVNISTTGTLDAGVTTLTSLATASLLMSDNLASALSISEGGNQYLTFVTTDGDEKVVFGKTFEGISGSSIGNLLLEDNSITTSNNGGVDFGTEALTTTGNLTVGNNLFAVAGASGNTSVAGELTVTGATTLSSGLSANNQNITNVADIEVDSITSGGNQISLNVADNQGIALKIEESTNNVSYVEIDTTDNSEEIRLLKTTVIDGTMTIGSGSIEDSTGTIDLGNTDLTTGGDITVQNLTVNGVQNINNQNNLAVANSIIELNNGFVGNNANDLGLLLTRGNLDDAVFLWDEGLDIFRLATHSGAVDINTIDFDAVAGIADADLRVGDLDSQGNISTTGSLTVNSTGTILAPAQAVADNHIVTAAWVRGLELSDLANTTEAVQDIVGAQFTLANHSTGITFAYTDDGGVNDGQVTATLQDSLVSIASLNPVAGNILYTTGNNTFAVSAVTQEGRDLIASDDPHAHLNLEVGVDVQEQNDRLTEISAIAQPTADNFLAGDGADLVLKTPTQARTSLGIDQVNARATLGFGTAVSNDTGDFLASNSGLDDLNDVTITNDPQAGTPLVNQVLVYTGNSLFENIQLSSNQLSDGTSLIKTSSSINDLSDVDTTNKAQGKVLIFNAQGALTVGDNTIIEESQDAVGSLINSGTQTDITVTYDDVNDKIDFSVDATIARVNSPTLTGTPESPTAVQGDDSTQIATTAFVQNEIQFINVGGNFQPVNDRLTEISAIAAPTADNFLAGDGNDIVLKTSTQARTSLGIDQANARATLGFGTAVTNDTGDFLSSNSGLDDLSDISIAVPANKHFIVHDGANFENRLISTADLLDGSEIPLLNGGDLTLNGSLSVTEISLTDNQAEALVFTEAGNDYLTFVTTDAGEKVVFGKEIESSAGATLGNLVLSGTSISSGGNGVSFGAENITTTGSVTCVDLTVTGTLTTIDTDNLSVKDRVIELNNGIGGNNNTLDIGLFLNRGDLDDAVVLWDEGEDAFVFATHSGAVDGTSTDFSSVAGLSKAPVQTGDLNVEGDISSTLGVTVGGDLVVTGTGSITAPAAAANGNEIVTASWIRSLTLSDLTDTTEDAQDIAGAMFDHANHSTGLTASYDDADNRVDLTLSDNLQDIAELANTEGNFIVGDGNGFVSETPAQARTSLGIDQANARATLGFGTAVSNDTGDFLASNSGLNDLSDVTVAGSANKHFIVHDGANFENRVISTADLSDGGNILLLQGGNLTINGTLSVTEISLTDNQAEALIFTEAGNDYLTFVTTDGSEKVVFGKEIESSAGATLGNLVLSGTSITSGGNGVSFGAENISTIGDLTVGNNLFTVAGASGNTSISGNLTVTGSGSITAPAAAANGNEIVTASWIRSLTLSDLTDTTEDAQDITGSMFDHANHSTGLTASYDDANSRVDLALSSNLQDISGLAVADGNFIVGDGGNFVAETPAQVRASLDLEIGTDIQAQSGLLDDISALEPLGADKIIYTDAQGSIDSYTVTSVGLDLLDDATVADQRATLGLKDASLADTTVNGGGADAGKAILTDVQGKLGALDGSNLTSLGSVNTLSDVNVTTGDFVGDEVLVWNANAGEFVSTILAESARDAVGSALEAGTHAFVEDQGISFTHDDVNNQIDLEIGINTSNLIDINSQADTNKQVLRYTTDNGLNKYVPTVLGTSTEYNVGTSPNELILLSSPTQSNVNAVADLIVLGQVIETVDYGSVGDAFVQNTDFSTDWNGAGFNDPVIYAEVDHGVLVS